jgi:uncharacterized membrane protein
MTAMTSTSAAPTASVTAAVVKSRIASIDIMRGLVMLIMLMDHVREKLYLHVEVGDPVNLDVATPDLFFSRIAAHLCAPVFVFLTGVSAWLYSHPARGGYRSPSRFLFTRGLFLVFIEVTVVNFSWFGTYNTLYLQVIWAIGLSMIALSILVKLNYWAVGAIGFVIVFGHNLLTPITFVPGEFGYSLWTILHDRGVLVADGPLVIKVSYPVLPWIGVILLGYFVGPLYARTMDELTRRKILLGLGAGCLALLAVLRGFNIYGETLPWVQGETATQTVMSFLNYTKYPPSLAFLLLTLGIAFFLLALFEKIGSNGKDNKWLSAIETFGSAPMFFYILHLYVLLIGYQILLAIFGANQGELFGVEQFWWVWVATVMMAVILYPPTRAFARFKHSSRQAWVRYF